MDIITLLKDLVSGLLQAEENFLGALNTFLELEQIASELSRRMAADFIGLVLSDAYLSTVFKKEMGQNFIEYVNRRKVALAKKLLEEDRLVYEVSELLGFENNTYFSKVFKRYEGVSPDAYRRRYECAERKE